MSDQLSEQRINIKFCVKIEKNKWHLCNALQGLDGRSYIKKSVFEWHKQVKESLYFKSTNEDEAHHFLWYQEYYFESIPQGQKSIKLIMWKFLNSYVKLCVEKGLKFGPTIGFSTMTMLQLTQCSLSSSFWPKNQLLKWHTHPTPLGSEWLLAVSKN
jgi:hypothetical protein